MVRARPSATSVMVRQVRVASVMVSGVAVIAVMRCEGDSPHGRRVVVAEGLARVVTRGIRADEMLHDVLCDPGGGPVTDSCRAAIERALVTERLHRRRVEQLALRVEDNEDFLQVRVNLLVDVSVLPDRTANCVAIPGCLFILVQLGESCRRIVGRGNDALLLGRRQHFTRGAARSAVDVRAILVVNSGDFDTPVSDR